jgi:hypothetical protein
MHILYLDESGEPSNWANQKNFIIAGVAVHEGQVSQLIRNMNAIQDRYFPGIAMPIEFHAEHVKHSKGWFKNFPLSKREQILEDVYNLILNTGFPNIIVFATALNIDVANDADQVRSDTFEEVCCQFNNFLIWQYRLGHPTKGLVIVDKNREDDYRKFLKKFQTSTKYGYLGNVIDIPYFAQSHETRLLQLADFCAYATWRYYEGQDEKYLKIIQPRICRKPSTNLLDGLKHLTNNKSCTCLACSQSNQVSQQVTF